MRNSHTGDKSCRDGGGNSMRKALSLVLIAVLVVVALLGTVSCKSSNGGIQEVTYNLGTEPTRLGMISYAVFCLKKKKKEKNNNKKFKSKKKKNKHKIIK